MRSVSSSSTGERRGRESFNEESRVKVSVVRSEGIGWLCKILWMYELNMVGLSVIHEVYVVSRATEKGEKVFPNNPVTSADRIQCRKLLLKNRDVL